MTRPAAAAGPPLRPSPNWPLWALSVLGMILTGYLSWTALNNEAVRGCSVGSGCDTVLSSPWATTLGMPTAFWGFLTYVALAATAFVKRVDRHWQIAWTVSFFGLIYSLYLTAVSMTVLKAACPYCLTSLGLMTAIFALVTWQRPNDLAGFAWGALLTRAVPLAIAVIIVLHLQYTGVFGPTPGQEDPLARALAEHLSNSGNVKFYGASWCPHCQDQKALFGAAAKRLPYVECSPDGQGAPQAPVCANLEIKSYPTWIINGKRIEQVMTMTDLANATNFRAPVSK
ncbi:MAG TPA: vitamin K epoxide reductase family protein [Terriglobia bacterium]|nr:vitamin K epoxide reductase family protein [Terriglobia bacterium]